MNLVWRGKKRGEHEQIAETDLDQPVLDMLYAGRGDGIEPGPIAIADSEPGLDGCLAPSRSFRELAAVDTSGPKRTPRVPTFSRS